jgi:hypothetical protein
MTCAITSACVKFDGIDSIPIFGNGEHHKHPGVSLLTHTEQDG